MMGAQTNYTSHITQESIVGCVVPFGQRTTQPRDRPIQYPKSRNQLSIAGFLGDAFSGVIGDRGNQG
jgi:hypothetical protein